MRRRVASSAWLTVADDGTLTLRLRMPELSGGTAWEAPGTIEGVSGLPTAMNRCWPPSRSNAEYSAYRRQHGEKSGAGN